MAPALILSNNNTFNPLTLDLSRYLDLTPDSDMDPQDPAFSNKVISHSLLKEGGVLALEDLQAKELVFPVKLSTTSSSALANLIIQINQVITAAGATFSWQDSGMSQPTIFDGISGQLDIKYKYREAEKFWCQAELKLFTLPLGHTAGPRAYAAASGVGPVLMISPYASGGQLIIGQSTQAGVSGYGGAPLGASSGIFYAGAPSLAGDAPSLLQVSYQGPMPSAPGAPIFPMTPAIAVSVLPNPLYAPIVTAKQLISGAPASQRSIAGAVASTIWTFRASVGTLVALPPGGNANPAGAGFNVPPLSDAGGHRLFVLARASQGAGVLINPQSPITQISTVASVAIGDWNIYDLGTYTLGGSEAIQGALTLYASPAAGVLDVNALVCLPERSTWFFPGGASGSRFVTYNNANSIFVDDTIDGQFGGDSSHNWLSAISIASAAAFSTQSIAQDSRGLFPRPNPADGLPIIAVLGVGNLNGSQISNPLTQFVSAQVNVLERARYVLP